MADRHRVRRRQQHSNSHQLAIYTAFFDPSTMLVEPLNQGSDKGIIGIESAFSLIQRLANQPFVQKQCKFSKT